MTHKFIFDDISNAVLRSTNERIADKANELYGVEKDLTYSGHYFIVIRRCDRSSIKTLFSLIDKNNQEKVRQGKRIFDTPQPKYTFETWDEFKQRTKPRLTRPDLKKKVGFGWY